LKSQAWGEQAGFYYEPKAAFDGFMCENLKMLSRNFRKLLTLKLLHYIFW
jgi:hypothetical protein